MLKITPESKEKLQKLRKESAKLQKKQEKLFKKALREFGFVEEDEKLMDNNDSLGNAQLMIHDYIYNGYPESLDKLLEKLVYKPVRKTDK